MKFIKVILVLALFIGVAGCSSEPKRDENGYVADPIIEKERKRNARLEKQTSEEMFASRQIPSVNFEFDSVHLAASAYPILDKVAGFMVGRQHIKLIVEGHTDNVGSDEYNDWLSEARAIAVKSYIVSRGVHPDSIKVYGFGKRRPLTLDDSIEGRATNRRIVFTVTDRTWNSVY
ncbi:Outer membrane protein [Elusimicrobium minutum Pei191]|uniref:Outer membrane protein n=1 Tax=Elusimicrobium minutum (strain Pei191) TaxID=445932 RepID=B2KBX3_ELUMP|nr:OmpA family protein [Elusimicrobium minutum]ACC97877.1 Outer membrane protein [Elusimicrobium minutum Pei191]